jgi:UDP-3-O-[3-hydroxymyristoyl] N-acetylglucosamine deacetylase/3-hydroxyacyl-[acyl-carrier-protein] dehydratase
MPTSQNQTTLKQPFQSEGRGLHTGKHATVKALPAPAGSGYRFRRTDLAGQPEVHANLDHVTATERGTVVKEGEASAATIEHLLGAFYGMGVDNVLIEISGPEVPILDGSGLEWAQHIKAAGIEVLDAPRTFLDVKAPFSIESGAKSVQAKPASRLELLYRIDYHHPALGQQEVHLILDPEAFFEAIAPARTFCFEHEVEALRKAGLIKGGDLDCALVVGEHGVLNPPVRFPDEFVRHKALDFLGDLALGGFRVRGAFTVERAGHGFHVEAMKALIASQGPPRSPARSKMSETLAPQAPPAALPTLLDVREIQKLLPHRFPMLLIDRVHSIEPMQKIVGSKSVSINEWFFQGHFPDYPIMPGVLIIEGMAQAGGILVMKSLPDAAGKLTFFMAIDNARFRRQVVPGDTLRYEVSADKIKSKVSKLIGKAYVGTELAAEAELMCMVAEK